MKQKHLIACVVCIMTMCCAACTQETQNRLGRSIQNWTGTDGVLDVYTGEKLVVGFIKIDKMSTAIGTGISRLPPVTMVFMRTRQSILTAVRYKSTGRTRGSKAP